MAYPSALAILKTHLLTLTAITNLTTSGRIWVGNIPESINYEDMPQALEIAKSGGTDDGVLNDLDRSNPISECAIQIKCYGRTWWECEILENTLTDALNGKQNIDVSGSTIHRITKTLNGQQIQDPVNGYYYHLTMWTIRVQ